MQSNLALLQLLPLSVFQSRRSIWTTSPACFHPGPPLPPLHPSYASFSLSHLSHHPAVTMLRTQISLIKQELSIVRKKQIWLLSTYHIDLHHSIRRLKQIQSNNKLRKPDQSLSFVSKCLTYFKYYVAFLTESSLTMVSIFFTAGSGSVWITTSSVEEKWLYLV